MIRKHVLSITTFASLLALGAATSASAAGSVQVNLNTPGNIMSIAGTDASDEVLLRITRNNGLLVRGLNGTTVTFEGTTSERIVIPESRGAFSRTTITMLGGDDRVVIRDMQRARMDVRAGDGNDVIVFRGDTGFNSGRTDGGDGVDRLVGETSGVDISDDVEVLRRVTSTPDLGTDGPVDVDAVIPVSPGASFSADINLSERFVFNDDIIGSTVQINDFIAGGGRFPEDVYDLSAIDADTTTPGDQAFTLVHAFTRTPGEFQVPRAPVTAGTNVAIRVSGDVDGDGIADFSFIGLNVFSGPEAGPWGNNVIR